MSSVGAGLCPARCGNPLTLVGATLAVARPTAHPMQDPVSLRSQCVHWLWQSVTPTPCLNTTKASRALPKENPGIFYQVCLSHFTQIFFFSIQAAPVTDSTMAAAIMTMWLLSPVAGALTTRGMVSVLVAWHTWQV